MHLHTESPGNWYLLLFDGLQEVDPWSQTLDAYSEAPRPSKPLDPGMNLELSNLGGLSVREHNSNIQ